MKLLSGSSPTNHVDIYLTVYKQKADIKVLRLYLFEIYLKPFNSEQNNELWLV